MKFIAPIFLFGISIFLIYFERNSVHVVSPTNDNIRGNRRVLLLSQQQQDELCQDQQKPQDSPSRSEVENADKAISDLRDNAMIDAVKTGDWDSYYGSLVQIYIGPLLVACFAFIIWFAECLQCGCQGTCPSFQRDMSQDPYADWSIWLTAIIAVISSMFVLSFSITGIELNRLLIPSLRQAECTTLAELQEMIYGKPSVNWNGVTTIPNLIQTISDELVANQANFALNFNQSEFLGSNIKILSLITDDIYKNLKDYKVTVPNPDRTIPKDVSPDLIYSLGQPDTPDQSQVVGSLINQYDTETLKMTDLMQKLRESSSFLGTNTTDIVDALSKGQEQIEKFKTSMLQLESDTHDFVLTFNDLNENIYNFGYAIFALSMFFSIIGVFGIICAMGCKIIPARGFIYMAWFMMSFLMIGGFLLAIFNYTLSLVTWELCETFNKYITDQTAHQSMTRMLESDQVETCFFGNGDLVESFGIRKNVLLINQTYSDLKNIDAVFDLYTQSVNRTIIDNWIEEMNKYRNFSQQGIQLSIVDGVQPFDLPENSLDKLNSWSDLTYTQKSGQSSDQYNSNCGTMTKDMIVFTKKDCQTKVPPVTATSNVGGVACLHLDNPTYNDAFIESRVNAVPDQTCPGFVSYQANYKRFYTEMQRYTLQLINILDSPINKTFYNFRSKNYDYRYNLQSLYNKTNTVYRNQLSQLHDSVANPMSGFLNSLNCSNFRNNFQNIRQSIYYSYFLRVYKMAIIVICNASLSIFSSIAFFFATSRIHYFITQNFVRRIPTQENEPENAQDQYNPVNQSQTNENSHMQQKVPVYQFQFVVNQENIAKQL